MRYFIGAVVLAAAMSTLAAAEQGRPIVKASTDQTTYVRIIDSGDGTPETGVTSATSGLDLEYVRTGAAPVDLTESDLGSTSASHSDGGIIHVGGGNYRVDLPDAAVASGVNEVIVQGTVTGMIVLPVRHTLVNFDVYDADPNVDVAKWLGTAPLTPRIAGLPEVAPPAMTWFVSDDTDGAGDTGTYNAAFDTFADAQTAARAGDTIYILDTYSSKISVTKSGLTITGSGSVEFSGSDSTNNGTIYVASGTNYTTIRDLTVKGTHSADGTAIRFGTLSDTSTMNVGNRLIGCKLEGRYDCTFMYRQQGLVIENCEIISKTAGYDGAYFSYCNGTVQNCFISTDGTYSPYPSTGTRGIIAGLDCRLLFRNCHIISTRAAASSYDCAAFQCLEAPYGTYNDSQFTLDDCVLYAAAAHASDTGRAQGVSAQDVVGTRYAYRVMVRGGRIVTSNAGGSGFAYDVDAPSGSVVTLVGPVAADRTKFNATGATVKWLDRDPLQPTTVDRTLDVASTGEAGVDLSNVNGTLDAAEIGADAITDAKVASDVTIASVTGAVGSVTGAVGSVTGNVSGSVASVATGGITAASIATGAVDADALAADAAAEIVSAALATTNGAATLATQWARLDAAVSSAGGGGTLTDVDQEPVPSQRTFILKQTSSGLVGESSKTIYKTTTPYTYAVSFANDMATNQRINTVDAVAIQSGTGGGVTFANYGRDRGLAKFRVTPVTAGTYVVRVAVTYNDGAEAEGRITFVIVE